MVVYMDGSSKEIDVFRNTDWIGDWGRTDMKSRECTRRIPREMPHTNSVGELLTALDAAKSFCSSTKVVLVTNSTYVRNCFPSVHKWKVNGWFLPRGH